VHPEQPDYFEQPWRVDEVRFSFDYDCSGTESAKPGQSQAPSVCAGIFCGARGFVETRPRPEVGIINLYCGSNVIRECLLVGCAPSQMTTDQFFVCK
jgi:hypothetical protein